MRISEVMTRDVVSIAPDASIREAARRMDDLNVGVLPVTDGQRLVGILTDRDITVRATAAGAAPDTTRVGDIMSEDVRWCAADDDTDEVLQVMSALQVRRVPVLDERGDLMGIVALGDLAEQGAPGTSETLREISWPAEPDRTGAVGQREGGQADEPTPIRPNDEIQEELRDKLDGAADFDFESVDIEASEGEVHLIGTVESFPAKRRAVAIAYTIAGVRNVTDGLRLRKG